MLADLFTWRGTQGMVMSTNGNGKVDSEPAFLYLFAAWIISLVASLSALFIGEVLGQMPCDLCWFQRIFMFPLALILGIASWRSDWDIWIYGLPIACSGLLIAIYHTLLYGGVIPSPIIPCSAEGPSCTGDSMLILGLPIPGLAVGAFTLIFIFLLALRKATK